MKPEDVIEIADKSQIDRMPPDRNCRAPYWAATDEELEAFANEVERRTIERCTQICDAKANKVNSRWIPQDCAKEIRALQQEKQNDKA